MKISAIILTLIAPLALSAAIHKATRSPDGQLDARVFWNPKAVALYEGRGLLETEHADYPLLLPATVAVLWRATGGRSQAIPIIVSLCFAAAVPVMLYRAISKRQKSDRANYATAALLSAPFFITQAAAQYADIPLGLFMLAAIINLESPYLLGLFSGLAAATKNEGLLFAFVIAAYLLIFKRQLLARFALAASPFILAVILFKLLIAPPNDVVNSATSISKITEAGRYWLITKGFLMSFAKVSLWGAAVISAFWQGIRGGRRMLIIGAMLGGYSAVYLLTPHELSQHIATSVDRLILQLLPCALFVAFTREKKASPQAVADSSHCAPSSG